MKKKTLAILFVVILILAALTAALTYEFVLKYEPDEDEETEDLPDNVKKISETYTFSEPEINEKKGLTIINIDEADFQPFPWPVFS